MKNTKILSRSRGFTLVELLTVIAIIGILAAILIPTVGSVMDNARKATAASNLRQIGQGYSIYTTGGSRPKSLTLGTGALADYTATVDGYAAVLAKEAGLNDPKIWILGDDDLAATAEIPVVVAVDDGTGVYAPDTVFAAAPKSFVVVNGLSARAASNTPVGWTRGLTAAGTWTDAANDPVYGDNGGGHMVFVDGHVEFFDDMVGDGTTPGLMVNATTGAQTVSYEDATGKSGDDILIDSGS